MATSEYIKRVHNRIKKLRAKGQPVIVNLVPFTQKDYAGVVEKPPSIAVEKQEIVDKYGFISNADNNDGTAEQHTGRKNYKTVYNDVRRGAIDTWYDMPFFGRMDLNGFISQFIFDKNVDLIDVDTAKMLSYVAEAFLRMAEEYNARADSKICCRGLSEDTIIPKMKAIRSYEDPHTLRDAYLDRVYLEFFATTLQQYVHSEKIKSIDDFYLLLKNYLRGSGQTLTTPGFMESQESTVLASGLAVDIHDADPDDDAVKIRFLEDPNFEIIANLALKYGFKVDINIPWRLIFDYRTPEFKKYLKMHSLWEQESVSSFSMRYHDGLAPLAGYSIFSSNYNGFVSTLNKFYKRFIDEFPEYITHFSTARGGRLKAAFLQKETIVFSGPKVEKLYRKPENSNKFQTFGNLKVVSEKYIDWYADIRNIERNVPFSPALMRSIKRESRKIYMFAVGKLESGKNADFIYHSNMAINYIEYLLGTSAAFIKKSLTRLESDATMVIDKAVLTESVLVAPDKLVATDLDLSGPAASSTGMPAGAPTATTGY